MKLFLGKCGCRWVCFSGSL